jgi:hypothetical protein
VTRLVRGDDARICRIADVAPRHTYARFWMSPAIAAIVSSASSLA